VEKMRKPEIILTPLIALLVLTLVSALNSFAGSDFITIDTDQLHSMIIDNAYRLEGGREKQFTVIDTRTKEEYDEAHIFSATSIPEKNFEKTMSCLPKDKGILLTVYCNDLKYDTCKRWADKAAEAGYSNIVIYSERFSFWKKNKMPIAPFRNDP
jgi:rhodanese-related sulfurtransferase